MEQDIEKIVQAITIASDPRQSALHAQALEFLSSIQQNPDNAWRIGLSLFVDVGADNTRKYPPQVRFYALRILDDFLETKFVIYLTLSAVH
jgi:exportin-T